MAHNLNKKKMLMARAGETAQRPGETVSSLVETAQQPGETVSFLVELIFVRTQEATGPFFPHIFWFLFLRQDPTV